jgi:sterol desaturase/sphingolipid hydroxylase (fatty acid hydroxylase superfamily)
MLVYESILLPVIMFHHSNVRVPGSIDRVVRLVIVTPWMHWVHHSRYQPETDSNFASILSVWDRVFGTYRLRSDPHALRLGLDGFDRSRRRTLWGMLASPFRRLPGRGKRGREDEN